ncbi:MAG: AbrB family transcriptional regulator [Comamonas sp.]
MRRLPYPLAVLATLAWALVAARLCVWLGTPLPWMIGPLLATALASIAGLPMRSWTPLRHGGQWVIGTALGLYFTPEVVALLGRLWWAIALGIAWALLLGGFFGRWLLRVNQGRVAGLDGRTAFFSGSIGGASEMTLLAERHGARTDLVASAHSLRVLMVTVMIPFAMQWSGMHGLDATPPATRVVDGAGLVLLMAASGAGALLMLWARRTNPWFLGAFAAAMLLTALRVDLSAMPPVLSNAAQWVIGVSLGVRFTPDFLRGAPRWLLSVLWGTLALMLACAAFGAGLAWLTGLHPATLILATSPGGIAEMSITAKVLQLGVPVVVAFQVCRLVAVLVLVEPIYARWMRRQESSS